MRVPGSESKVHQHTDDAANPTHDTEPTPPKEKGGPTKESRGASHDGDSFEDGSAPNGPDLGSPRGGGTTDATGAKSLERSQEPPAVQHFTPEDARRRLKEKDTEATRGVLADWEALDAKGKIKFEERDMKALGEWSEPDRTIVLNKNGFKDIDEYTEVLTHELTHASQSDRLHPERDGVTRGPETFSNASDYADHRVEMESRAQARTLEVLHDLRHKSMSKDLQTAYEKGKAQGGREGGIQAMNEAIKADKGFPGTWQNSYDWWQKYYGASQQQAAGG